MRRTRRSLTLLLKVTALMSAVAWTAARHELATAGTVTVLVALSILSLRPRPRLRRSRAAVIASLVLALGMAVTVARAWMFVPAILAVWAGLAALAALAWMCTQPRVRSAAAAFLRPRRAPAGAGAAATSEHQRVW